MTVLAGKAPQIGRLFYVHDKRTNARFLVDTGSLISVIPVDDDRPHATTLQIFAANGTTIPIFCTQKLTVQLGPRRRYLGTFILAAFPTGILEASQLLHRSIP